MIWTVFARDRQGGLAVATGIMAPILFGFAAIAVDVANARMVQTRLQNAGDAAALAASQKLPDTTAATTAALAIAVKNTPAGWGTTLQASDIVYGKYDTATQTFTVSAVNPNAVQLRTSRTAAAGNALRTTFGWAVGKPQMDIATKSTAYRSSGPTYCVYVLDGNANSALSAGGGGTLIVPNCGVQVNSGHNKAAAAGNATDVSAKSFCLVGGYNGTFTPSPQTGCPALADPLLSIPEPSAPNGGTCYSGSTPQPNQTYCGTYSISSDVNIPAGIYYFKNASVTFSGGNVTGSGVMFFLDTNSTMDFSTNGTVSLTAPTSGTYAGISIFQSRSAPLNNTIKVTGGGNFLMDGTIYTPRAHLSLYGNSTVSVTSKSGYLIANKISFTGASTFSVGAWGGTQALGKPQKAAIVE
jgi:Flp pilus assembly protein TadG